MSDASQLGPPAAARAKRNFCDFACLTGRSRGPSDEAVDPEAEKPKFGGLSEGVEKMPH